MGYRSEVAVRFDLPSKFGNDVKGFLEEIKKQTGIKNLNDLFDGYYTDKFYSEEDNVVILYAEYVKWYSGFYDDVDKFEEFMNDFEDFYEDGAVHFVRIGENLEDIEEKIIGDPSGYLDVIREVGFKNKEDGKIKFEEDE